MNLPRNFPLVLLRMVIGWHFLYEGLTKLLYPGWTSSGYLKGSSGPMAGLFQWLAAQSTLIAGIDFLNVWGLLAIGLALMAGVAVRPAAWCGIGLLTLYYLAYPPFFTPFSVGAAEGAYLIVNKNLVELFALSVVIAFPGSHCGLEHWLRSRPVGANQQRRELLADLAGIPVLGMFVLAVLRKHGWRSFEEANLARRKGPDQFSTSATVKTFQFAGRVDLKGTMPIAAIRNLNISRMIMGGNLIGGWAHARDLIYVSKLVRAYHHREKIFQTLAIAESCGLNSLITNPALCGVINDYWRNGGKIQFISDCGNKDLLGAIRKSIDQGASACYIQGALADELVKAGKFDLMAEGLELIRKNGLPAGIGAHELNTVVSSVERGLRPDFWMKTLH